MEKDSGKKMTLKDVATKNRAYGVKDQSKKKKKTLKDMIAR